MKFLRESFSEPVGKGLQRDLVVIVVLFLEALDVRFDAVDGNRECADIILHAFLLGRDEVGERHVVLPACFFRLLPQEFEADSFSGVVFKTDTVSRPFEFARQKPATPFAVSHFSEMIVFSSFFASL